MFRFVHSSDLHIGKRFGNLPEDLRGRLREARHQAIGRLAGLARANGASVVLLAGDTFDTETPAPAMLRQSLAAMGDDPAIRWIVLPGNHDSRVADELWRTALQHVPANVMLALEPEPVDVAPGAVVLPAPCTTRRPGRDLSEWMDGAATDDGTLRIGLAHGAIRDFSEEGSGSDVLAPDRAARAGLDYLALGDWHGLTRIDARTWYSGTPEPDRFKHREPGRAIVVSIEGAGAEPTVTPAETGAFHWRMLDLRLFGDEDVNEALAQVLPIEMRRRSLLRIAAQGRTRLPAKAELKAAVEHAAPDFAHVIYEDNALATVCESGDLDRIDHAGALRRAAETLLAESDDPQRGEAERAIARGALARLFSYSEDAAS